MPLKQVRKTDPFDSALPFASFPESLPQRLLDPQPPDLPHSSELL